MYYCINCTTYCKRLGSQNALYIFIHWICSLEGLMTQSRNMLS
jgi:hypothetical protein